MESCEGCEVRGLAELDQQLREQGLEKQLREAQTAEAAVETARAFARANAEAITKVLEATRPEVLRRALERTAELMGVEVEVPDPEKLRRLVGEFSTDAAKRKPLPPKES